VLHLQLQPVALLFYATFALAGVKQYDGLVNQTNTASESSTKETSRPANLFSLPFGFLNDA